MDDRDVRGQQCVAFGRDLAELAADHEQTIRRGDEVVGDAGIASEQTRRQRVRAGNGALAAHGVGNRRGGELDERLQRRMCAGEMHPATGQHQRPLGLREQRRRTLDRLPRRPRAPCRHRDRGGVDIKILGRELVLAVADVLENVDQHRAGTPRRRQRERAAHQFRNAVDLLDADQLLDGGAQDVDLPALLGHVLPGMGAMGVAGDRDQRRAGVERLDESGDEIGGARPERAVAHAGAARDPRIGVRREGAGALVVDQMMAQPELTDRIVERQQLKAAHSEHRADARQSHHLGERAAAAHSARWAIGGRGVVHDALLRPKVWARACARMQSTNSGTLMPVAAPASAASRFTAESRPVAQAERASPMRALAAATVAAAIPRASSAGRREMPARSMPMPASL